MILCCGEALIDMVPAEMDGATVLRPLSGGAIFNTAISLGRLGVKTALVSGVSTDLFGQQLAQELENSQVATDFLVRSDRPNTLAFVQLVDGHATYTFYDEASAGRMLTVDNFASPTADTAALYFGGISLCIEPAAEAYEKFCTSNTDKTIMIDPNIRPSFITDRVAYLERINRMLAVADIVKVSDEDLDWLIEGAANSMEKLAQLKFLGPKIAIMTRGSQGAVALIGDGTEASVPATKVTVADTVGAGDTFNAGFLADLSKNGLLQKSKIAGLSTEQVQSALGLAAQVAAVTVSRAGANPPWLQELT